MSEDPLTPGVSQKTYTKSQRLDIKYRMTHNISSLKLKTPQVRHRMRFYIAYLF